MPSDASIQINVETAPKCRYCPDVPPGQYCDECGRKRPKKRIKPPLVESSPINVSRAERTLREMIQRSRREHPYIHPNWPVPTPIPNYNPPEEVEDPYFVGDMPNQPYTTTIADRTNSSSPVAITGSAFGHLVEDPTAAPF